VTAATPGPPPRDHRDGQVTPGQAAYEAYAMAAPDDLNFPEPDKLDDWEYPAWDAAAQAGHEAIAAQPQPAPMVRLAPCPAEGHDGEHVQWNSGGHWLCGQQVADALGAQGIFADRPELEQRLGEAEEQIERAETLIDDYRAEHRRLTAELTAVLALLDHETRLTWQSGLPGEQARVAPVREQAGLEALT
jgi:hypothetical protein